MPSDYGVIPYEIDEITIWLQNYLNENLPDMVTAALPGYYFDPLFKQWRFNKSSNLSDLLKSSDTEVNTTSTSYVKVKEITFNPTPEISVAEPCSLHLEWEQKCNAPTHYSYVKVYKNDIGISGDITVLGTIYTLKTYDLEDLNFNDKIQLYLHTGTGGDTSYLRNFRIYGTKDRIDYTEPVWS